MHPIGGFPVSHAVDMVSTLPGIRPGRMKGVAVSYNQPPPPPGGGYGAPQPAYGGGQAEHPQGTTILVLGIVGLVCCGIAAVVAWIMGNKAQQEIDAGQYAPTTGVRVGRILGMVGTILTALGLVFYLLFFVVLASS